MTGVEPVSVTWPSSLAALGSLSRQARESRPVFIVGDPRSGSTLLFRILQRHSAFAGREENLQESSFIVQAPRAHRFSYDYPRNLRRFMLLDEDAWNGFLTSIRPLRPVLRVGSLAQDLWPSLRDPLWFLGPSHLVARSYAVHAQRARGSWRLLEKTPTHIHHVAKLLYAFPYAKLLFIHRHPIDVYSSYRRRGEVDPRAYWARIEPEEFCHLYARNVMRAVDELAARPGSLFLIRYERLTSEPREELGSICAFLEEPFEERLIDNASDEDNWAHWERSSRLFGEITTHTKDWRDFVSPADAATIQSTLRRVMVRLGYEAYD